MRLLDHIAQSSTPFVVRHDSGQLWYLTGASDFARQLACCPLRYVLTNDLVSACTALAYSDGDELSGCLDLIRFPAERLWVEWDDAARRAALASVLPECMRGADPGILRAGTLLCAHPGERSGSLRTFWQARAAPGEAVLAAVETLLDLNGSAASAPPGALLDGQPVRVGDLQNPQVDALLQCARFRLDPVWQRYYQSVAHGPAMRAEVIESALAAVAFDIPLLFALFLLMTIRANLVQTPVRPLHLNAKRARLGRRPLLDHIELSAPVFSQARRYRAPGSGRPRGGPRLHHVRGHIVRRRDTVYWRGPHWRGHLRLGCVRSRTVELRLAGQAT